jgi:hypothetical protein
MKKLSLIITVASIITASVLLLTSCNWLFTVKDLGPTTTRGYEFTDFNAVDVGSAFTVDIEYGETYSVEITTNERIFDRINIGKDDDTLKISMTWFGVGFNNAHMEARITMPELTKLTLSGATEGTVRGFKSTNDFETSISGASELDLDIETGAFAGVISGSSELNARVKSTSTRINLSGASDLKIEAITGSLEITSSGASETVGTAEVSSSIFHLSGASSMELAGKGGNIGLSGSGGSSYKLMEYAIEDVNIGLSGASDADMVINGKLRGYLSGSSELRYEGTPVVEKDLDISGASTFKRR